jgi:hypothetical protein
MLIAGGNAEIFSRGVQEILDGQFIQGPGEAETAPRAADRADDSRLSQLEEDLFQKNGGNVFLLR